VSKLTRHDEVAFSRAWHMSTHYLFTAVHLLWPIIFNSNFESFFFKKNQIQKNKMLWSKILNLQEYFICRDEKINKNELI
jgi:hypothetical protein